MSTELPGLDLARLGPWLADHVPGAGPVRQADLIAGGKSNLTYAVGDGTNSWVVRRPPLGHVLASAHDMAREYRILAALHGSSVPVPEPLALCEDPAVIGAPFLVMERVEGTAYRRADELVPLGPGRTRELSRQFVVVLARLHRHDPEALGLGGFGRPDGFLRRQVARWKRQLDASDGAAVPGAQELYRRLAAAVEAGAASHGPPDAAIVHGDYRLDNLLVTVDGAVDVRAVLDWEMATLGDPLTDLALLVMYQRMAEWGVGGGTNDTSLAPGWLTEDDLVTAYEQAGGTLGGPFSVYLALAAFKLVAILAGIRYRHANGQTLGDGFESLAAGIDPLVLAGLAELDHPR